jgi:hypothetical protein
MVGLFVKNRTAETLEDIGTARLVARARREIAAGARLPPKHIVDRLAEKKKPLQAVRKMRAGKR